MDYEKKHETFNTCSFLTEKICEKSKRETLPLYNEAYVPQKISIIHNDEILESFFTILAAK